MRLSDAEWTVMRAVWNRAPATARDILDDVGDETGWAYTTVKTLLARLVEKGALSEVRQANVNIYEPRITRNEARGSALRSLLDRAFDGTFGSLFQHLITEERLSKRDVQTLEQMLQEVDSAERSERSSDDASTASASVSTSASASAAAQADAKTRRTRTATRARGRR